MATADDQPRVERASPADRAFLAMGAGRVPEQFGVVLLLGPAPGLDLAAVRQLIGERVPAVPRLRQRLVAVPFGCGGPIWADDPSFTVANHVTAVRCPPPGDEQALVDTGLAVTTTPLPHTAPLWAAVLVTGLAGDRAAVILVLHHVLADGVGGLAVLASLVDGLRTGPPRSPAYPRPAPGRAVLARDALTRKARGLSHVRRTWRLLRGSTGAGGGFHPPRAAACSLVTRTGPRRRAAVVRTSLAEIRTAAHAHGATVNDALLVAVAGALHRVLAAGGESLGTIAVAVPVSGRGQPGHEPAGDGALGNMVSPLLVPVPSAGDAAERLERVAALVRAHKAAATGPAPIAVLGWLFRPLARLGGYRWYMNHQHRLHTLVSHVRGPAEQVTFGGTPVIAAIPVSVGQGGNITVYFEVLSYAGTLTITVIADPDHFTRLGALTQALRAELDAVTFGAAHARPARTQCPRAKAERP
ncbi:MAG TPA: wax ester/triacylglycerol synthase domain-containing protein [Streptosporangiaceae bacterium]